MSTPSTPFGAPRPGFSSAHAEVNGAHLHYVRGGTGPAIILVHGFPEVWVEYKAIMPRRLLRQGMTHVESARIPAASHYALADNPDALAEPSER
jgi:hypothetical protein